MTYISASIFTRIKTYAILLIKNGNPNNALHYYLGRYSTMGLRTPAGGPNTASARKDA